MHTPHVYVCVEREREGQRERGWGSAPVRDGRTAPAPSPRAKQSKERERERVQTQPYCKKPQPLALDSIRTAQPFEASGQPKLRHGGIHIASCQDLPDRRLQNEVDCLL